MKWTDLIEKTKLSNEDYYIQKPYDPSFDTYDYLYLESFDDISVLTNSQRKTSFTDYSLMCGIFNSDINRTVDVLLRTPTSDHYILASDRLGFLASTTNTYTEIGLCPSLRLNLSSFLSIQKSLDGFGKIGVIKKESFTSHTIKMGEYPKTKVDSKTRDTFEKLLKSGKIKKLEKYIQDLTNLIPLIPLLM